MISIIITITSVLSLNPIILVPGLDGSVLEVKRDNVKEPHF